MSTRIRYVKASDGVVSMQVLKSHTTGTEYKTSISTDGKTGKVTRMSDGEVVKKVSGTSAHKTKIALKKALKELGVVFLNEKRVRSNDASQSQG